MVAEILTSTFLLFAFAIIWRASVPPLKLTTAAIWTLFFIQLVQSKVKKVPKDTEDGLIFTWY